MRTKNFREGKKMRKYLFFLIFILILTTIASAELKSSYNTPQKLTQAEMKDGPKLSDSFVYPQFGVACTNFTYSVIYKDEKGRMPEYIRINLNNKWHDMTKLIGEVKTGARYVYYYVPTSTESNFYYIEASNGVGKARAAIIDSPDQGPIIYTEKFDNNQIILLDKNGNEVWAFNTGIDQVEGVKISKDGNYIAAVTNAYIYLFSKTSKEPLWYYCERCEEQLAGSTNFAGVAISNDGKYIAADIQNKLYFFERESNKPVWIKDTESSAIGMDMSDDGSLIAVGVGNAGEKGDKIFLFDRDGNKISEYKATHPEYIQTGNFYQPDVTPNGKYIAISTGCPDRRAYLFSNKGDVLFRSEQLTYDSPVHKSAISDDGSLIAYSADNSQGKEIVFLYDNTGKKLWSFSSQEDATARAISISSDGKYIAAGTTAGNIYLFSKDSNKPLWKFDEVGIAQFGDVKLNNDGSLLAVAGTSKKVYLFSRENNKPLWGYTANTWVTKLDFNGEYIVAGTGLREYIGEGAREEKSFVCNKIINPSPMDQMENDGSAASSGFSGKANCGDGMCEGTETYEDCPKDCCGENCDINENIVEKKDDIVEKNSGLQVEKEGVESTLNENSVEKNIIEKNEELQGNKEGLKSIEQEIHEKGGFERVIDFFKRLFGK